MFFKEFLFVKEKKFFFLTNILNFLFILLPLCFFFSNMVVNTFCLIFCIYSFFLFYSINLRIIFDKLDKILLFFFLFLICAGITNKEITFTNVVNEIGLIRFFLIYFLIKNIVSYSLINFKAFFFSSFLCVFFLSVNIILIHIIGIDIFFNTVQNANIIGYERYSSFFKDRYVAGSYILNFIFFFLFFLFFLKKKFNYVLIFSFIFFFGLAILLSFDRSPFFLLILSILIINILNIKKKLFLNSIFIIFSLILIILTYPKAKIRYNILYNFIDEIIYYKEKKKITKNIYENLELYNKDEILNKNFSYKYYSHFSIYVDSINSILDEKVFFGSGKSSFKKRCSNYRINNDPLSLELGYAYACPNHSHNIYLEITLSTGVFGLIVFLSFLFLKIKGIVKILIILKKKNAIEYFYYSLLFTSLIIEIIPFRPYGNIFNSYNGLMFFVKVAIIYSYMVKFSKNPK